MRLNSERGIVFTSRAKRSFHCITRPAVEKTCAGRMEAATPSSGNIEWERSIKPSMIGMLKGGLPRMTDTSCSGSSMLRKSRSEEHTSELQSLMRISYAVFCLKKKIYITVYITEQQHNILH